MPATRHVLLSLLIAVLLAGCRQAIAIPDQEYLIAMGQLNACWRDGGSAPQCNCAVEKARERYQQASGLQNALNDPAQQAEARLMIKNALASCGL